MQPESGVAIFWDFETARIGGETSGYQIARNLSTIADQFGVVKSFRTYLDVVNQRDNNFLSIRKQLHSSGVTMVDCPSHSRRDIADKVMIVDMLSFILDQPPPYTIVVAASDNDLCFTLAVLRRRRYKVILVCPLQADCEDLAMQADETLRVDWIGVSENNDNLSSSPPSPLPPPSPSSSSILSYADFDAGPSGQNSGQKTGLTTKQSKNLNSLHVPSLESGGNGMDTGPQHSNGDRTPSPVDSLHDTRDMEKPRLRSGTFSGTFFPPAPSFPLEAREDANIRAATVHKSVAGRKSPSPQSTEDFSVVDPLHGSPPNLTRHSSPVVSLVEAVHKPSATTEFPATSSSELSKAPLHSVAVADATQLNHATLILATSATNAPLATAYPSVPAATILATATPTIKPSVILPPLSTSPALTPRTPLTKKTSGLATSESLPEKYRLLVKHLQICHRGGDHWPNGSKIASSLVKEKARFYESVGAKKWGQYSTQAVIDGIIAVNLKGEISLKDKWRNIIV